MKKISFVALLLSAVMILPLLCGCVDNATENSDTSIEASANVSENEQQGEPVENPEYETVVSLGKTYTASTEADAKYADTYNAELTDGVLAPIDDDDYNNVSFAGFSGSAPLQITIDLGSSYDRIYKVTAGYLSTTNAGIAPPASIEVHTSENGRKFTKVGEMTVPEFVEGKRLEAVLDSDYYIGGRYIKLVILKMNTWIFLDEITVIADEEMSLTPSEKYAQFVKDAYDKLGAVKPVENGVIPEGEYLKLISKGCNYTVTGEIVKGFEDKNSYLTDGENNKIYETGKWVGLTPTDENVTITVDLGKERDDICEFGLTCYSNNVTERYLPAAVTYSISTDGENFTDIGRIFGVFSGQNIYDFPLILETAVTARYVKFTLENTPTKAFVIEEAAVYTMSDSTERKSYYEPLSFDTEVKKWDTVSGERKNLIQGNIQQIFIPDHVTGVSADNLTPADTPLLTDGKKAKSNDIHNGQFYKFMSSSAAIEVYYDLGDNAALSEFTTQFTHRTAWGVQAPYKVFVYLSDDSETWYTAGVANVKPKNDNCVVDVSLKLNRTVSARYVCFYILTCNWVGISEFEVWGTTSTAGAATLANSGFKTKQESELGYKAPNENLLNGAKDLCLLYHSKSLNGFTVEKLLPYVAYVDTDGKIKDTMFDSFLFLLSGGFPSGSSGSGGYTDADMEWVINDLFTEGENILALEEAAGKVKEELGLDESFKYGLTVAVYQAFPDDSDLQKRVDAIKAQINQFEEKYNQYDFKNIELVAYYWFDEGVYNRNNEPELVKTISDFVHGKGLDFFWIPWYGASGVDSWQEHGFDVACMQPGYVFKEEVLDTRMEAAASMARYFGMGIEIEISPDSFYNETLYRRYLEYLSAGAKYGYLTDCVHMYYQEIDTYYEASVSGSEKVRKIYDYTYMFIKGTLPTNPEALETVVIECESNTPAAGNVILGNTSHYTFDILTLPEGGTVSLANDGSFVFFPEKDFKGKTQFTYTYNMGMGDSEVCTVEIEVK